MLLVLAVRNPFAALFGAGAAYACGSFRRCAW